MMKLFKINIFNGGLHFKNRSGFTILEVLIAMAIFAIGILGIASMQLSSINGNARSRDHMEAGENTQTQIETLMVMPFANLANGQSTTANGNNMAWVVTNGDIDGDGNDETRVIQVTVTMPSGRVLSDLTFTRSEDL